MIGRGILTLIDDTTKEQTVQIKLLDSEVHDSVERYQEYGFTSVPKSGAECITVSVGGNRGHSVVIATGDREYRLKGLEDGEVAIYDDQGQCVHLKRGGIELKSPSVTITADSTTITGTLTVNGAVTANQTLDVTGNISSAANITAGGSIIDTAGNTANHSHV
jgi:phage baseplate assembly protein V